MRIKFKVTLGKKQLRLNSKKIYNSNRTNIQLNHCLPHHPGHRGQNPQLKSDKYIAEPLSPLILIILVTLVTLITLITLIT